MEKKSGRPSDNPRREKLSIRLSDEEIRKLLECTQALNTTRTEIVAKGIEMVYDSIKK